MNNPPLKMVTCRTCFTSQRDTGQTECKNGHHPFVLYVPPPLKGFQPTAKTEVLSPRESPRSVDPIELARQNFLRL